MGTSETIPPFADRLRPYPGPGVLAVSGGADSMALMQLMPARFRGRSLVVSFDHKIRPESRNESEQVVARALRLGYGAAKAISLDDLNNGTDSGLQLRAREARRRKLIGILKSNKLGYIYTGHHRDDWYESIFAQWQRHRGLQDCRGIDYARGPWIRPLLLVSAQEIRDWLTACAVHWFEDESNRKLVYQRNRIRHVLLPRFQQEGKGFPFLKGLADKANVRYKAAHAELMRRSGASPETALALEWKTISSDVRAAVLSLWSAKRGLYLSRTHHRMIAEGARKVSVQGGWVTRIDNWLWLFTEDDYIRIKDRKTISDGSDPHFRKEVLDKSQLVPILNIERGYPAQGRFDIKSPANGKKVMRKALLPSDIRPWLFWFISPCNQRPVFEFAPQTGRTAVHLLP